MFDYFFSNQSKRNYGDLQYTFWFEGFFYHPILLLGPNMEITWVLIGHFFNVKIKIELIIFKNAN